MIAEAWLILFLYTYKGSTQVAIPMPSISICQEVAAEEQAEFQRIDDIENSHDPEYRYAVQASYLWAHCVRGK